MFSNIVWTPTFPFTLKWLILDWKMNNAARVFQETGTAYPSDHLSSPPVFWCVRIVHSFVFFLYMFMSCSAWFVFPKLPCLSTFFTYKNSYSDKNVILSIGCVFYMSKLYPCTQKIKLGVFSVKKVFFRTILSCLFCN